MRLVICTRRTAELSTVGVQQNCPPLAYSRSVHLRRTAELSTFGVQQNCPPSAYSRSVHLRRTADLSTVGVQQNCPPSAYSRTVHRRRTADLSTFGVQQNCPPLTYSRTVHLRRTAELSTVGVCIPWAIVLGSREPTYWPGYHGSTEYWVWIVFLCPSGGWFLCRKDSFPWPRNDRRRNDWPLTFATAGWKLGVSLSSRFFEERPCVLFFHVLFFADESSSISRLKNFRSSGHTCNDGPSIVLSYFVCIARFLDFSDGSRFVKLFNQKTVCVEKNNFEKTFWILIDISSTSGAGRGDSCDSTAECADTGLTCSGHRCVCLLDLGRKAARTWVRGDNRVHSMPYRSICLGILIRLRGKDQTRTLVLQKKNQKSKNWVRGDNRVYLMPYRSISWRLSIRLLKKDQSRTLVLQKKIKKTWVRGDNRVHLMPYHSISWRLSIRLLKKDQSRTLVLQKNIKNQKFLFGGSCFILCYKEEHFVHFFVIFIIFRHVVYPRTATVLTSWRNRPWKSAIWKFQGSPLVSLPTFVRITPALLATVMYLWRHKTFHPFSPFFTLLHPSSLFFTLLQHLDICPFVYRSNVLFLFFLLHMNY